LTRHRAPGHHTQAFKFAEEGFVEEHRIS
jgi:hypothetical protein